jgi:hypothetical protein
MEAFTGEIIMKHTASKLSIAFFLSLLLIGTAFAQEQKSASAPAPVVTATAKGKQVRFAALGEVRDLRLEVFDAYGQKVFDSSFHSGNLLDWQVQDQQGQRLSDGSYMYVVTIRDLSEGLTQKYGNILLQQQQISLEHVGRKQLPEAQAQALEASRQSGAQSPVDRVGVEVPSAEGTTINSTTVLAQGNSASNAASGNGTQSDGPVNSATSTPSRVAKWTDGAGTLGDSSIAEVNGKVGIGVADPLSVLHVNQPNGTSASKGIFLSGDEAWQSGNGTNNTGIALVLGVNRPGNRQLWVGDRDNLGSTTSGFFRIQSGIFNSMDAVTGDGNTRLPLNLGTNTTNIGVGFNDFNVAGPGSKLSVAGNLSVGGSYKTTAAPTEGMIVEGNVGIGTTAPTQKLDVNGNIKLTGATSKLIFADGSSMNTASAGGSPSGNSVVNAINDPATTTAINDNRLSGNVAKLNGANAWSGANTFASGLSANNALVTNVGNPVNAGDATNKAYVDASTVKFVPAAEQLSVGDANGTAPMINLRGGSTCCSGPGGHTPAWFKVFQNGSFVATGNLGIGVSPMEGKGYRTSWYTYKGAFRSGYADNEWDDANTGFFSWAGGSNSTASGLYSFSFGDTNFATSTSSIAFGSGNEVKGAAGFSAGAGNRVCDTYGVAFGNKAQSGGPLINGKCDPDSFNITGLAAIALGYNVTADKDHSTAMGKFASNNGFSGTFVWSDGSATASADTFRNTANNEFAARATGGFRFRTNLTGTTGCNLPAGSGVFNCTSSRYTKENFFAVSGEDVLNSLRKIPVTSWNYISEGQQVRHLGPMAEDFYKAFRLGTGNTSIGVQDLAGVSLAAVKALDQRTTELQQKTAEVEQLRAQVNTLEQRLNALEANMKASTAAQHTVKGRRR